MSREEATVGREAVSPPRPAAALAMALMCHTMFLCAVTSMAIALGSGLQIGRGPWHGVPALAADALLIMQFPLVHSFLLSRRGRVVLQRLSPVGHGRTLAASSYALVASLQLLLTFWAWSPTGEVWHRPVGLAGGLQWPLFGCAWLFLVKALGDAGLALQTGAAGWWALLHGRPVDFGRMPTGGLFARCRQPIYLGFAMVLWTAPTWSPDWLVLAVAWSAYCVTGPRFKEASWARRFGASFAAYRAEVPYMLPRIHR